VAVLWVACSSYSYSETIYGTTNNAAAGGLTWSMADILPDYAGPNISLKINGVIYQYTMNKEKEADAKVHVRNEHVDGGYIFEKTDDWSGKYGATLRKFYTFPGSNAELWGDGEMTVEGDGSITDASLVYAYRMDIDEAAIQCINPLSDPTCPGFLDALYKYLQEMGLLEPSEDDPYYEQWLEAQKAELQEEEEANEEEEKEQEEFEESLRVTPSENKLIDSGQQQAMLEALANLPQIEPYYQVTIEGGAYTETITLSDSTLPDNPRALRQFASDAKHKTMVRSQYDREQ